MIQFGILDVVIVVIFFCASSIVKQDDKSDTMNSKGNSTSTDKHQACFPAFDCPRGILDVFDGGLQWLTSTLIWTWAATRLERPQWGGTFLGISYTRDLES